MNCNCCYEIDILRELKVFSTSATRYFEKSMGAGAGAKEPRKFPSRVGYASALRNVSPNSWADPHSLPRYVLSCTRFLLV